jgi:hypothetical protein
VLTTQAALDGFVAAYASGGTLVWARTVGGPNYDELYAVAAAVDGSLRLAGGFYGTATFGVEGIPEVVNAPSAGAENVFVASYASTGTLAWASQATGPDTSVGGIGYGLAVDAAGATFVTGWYLETQVLGFGETHETPMTAIGAHDGFLAKYFPDGTLDWAVSAGGGGEDSGYGVAALPDGTVLVCGSYQDGATIGLGDPNETVLTSLGDHAAFLARYNGNGSL